MIESPFLTVSEAAQFLRCSDQMIYKLVRTKRIHPARVGDRLLFHKDLLADWAMGRVRSRPRSLTNRHTIEAP